MAQITVENFGEKFPEIQKSLQNAKFIGLDLEFSALFPLKNFSPSLFDNGTDRYTKLRKNIMQLTPIQVGLTAFSFDRDRNTYYGTVYNFYVIPAAFPTVHRSFYFQSDTLNFLRLYDFDFNKFVYSGIPYINSEQESELRRRLKNNEISEIQVSCKTELEDIFDEVGNEIMKWHNSAKNGEQLLIPRLGRKYKTNYEMLYFIHKHIRSRFKNIWTIMEEDTFIVKKVSVDDIRILEKNCNLEEELLTNILGFTRVFRLLTSLQKPIVGHNLLQDVLLMINSFEVALPPSYSKFKKIATTLFPTIFDTKTVSYNIKKIIPEEKKFSDTGLESIFEYFKDGTGRHLALNSPAIEIIGVDQYGKFHEAGWDSFCAGYIFIRMAYLNVFQKYPKSKTFMCSELIGGLDDLKNQLNVIRGSISSIKIDGEDPDSTRPPYLVIESVKNRPVDIPQVTSILSSFGFVEIRKFPLQTTRALVAVDNFGNAKRILNNFRSHSEFQVKQYNVLKHSPVVRAVLLSGITISGAILLWATHCAMKK